VSTITFTSLQCLRKQELSGFDETHIFLDGVDSWNGAFKKDDTDTVNMTRSFDGSMKVEVKEKGPGWKSLGTVTLQTGSHSPAVFKTSGAHYELRYRIQD
jgi:hypothetical protein